MKTCEICGGVRHPDDLVENGALWCCNECDAHLCEYCAKTTEHPLIPMQNDAGYIAKVCPVCTLETALRMFDAGLNDEGYEFVSLAIKSLKGE